MTLKITEHLPLYVTGSEPEIVNFDTTGELLSLDFVKGHFRQPGFHRYSIHKVSGNTRVPFLAEYNGGEKWIVIGFLDGDVSKVDLPAWNENVR